MRVNKEYAGVTIILNSFLSFLLTKHVGFHNKIHKTTCQNEYTKW